MNLGAIWERLSIEDKNLIIHAIEHFGNLYTNSYLYKHRNIKYRDPKLVFLKIKPVFYALIDYKQNVTNIYDKERIERMINLIKIILRCHG